MGTRRLRIRNKDKYTEIVDKFKTVLGLETPIKLSPFKDRRRVGYYNHKEDKLVIFVPNTKDDDDFLMTLLHELAHVIDLNRRKAKDRWRNHHNIDFFMEYYRLLCMNYGEELPMSKKMEFYRELGEYNISIGNFEHYYNEREAV